MPKNPSESQKEASKNNLKGKYGPKTASGKLKSSLNGKNNKGAKSAKSRARIINSRWGINNSYYNLANCLHCVKICKGKSFSDNSSLNELPIKCYNEIINIYPHKCFYYFYGLCGTRYFENITENFCVIDNYFLEDFFIDDILVKKFSKELAIRKEFIAFRKEFKKYINIFIEKGFENVGYSPRMKYVIKQLKRVTENYCICVKTNVSDIKELDNFIYSLIFVL